MNDPDFYDRPELFMPERYVAHEFGLKDGSDATGWVSRAKNHSCPASSVAIRVSDASTVQCNTTLHCRETPTPLEGVAGSVQGFTLLRTSSRQSVSDGWHGMAC